jgi:hypothetical protein
MKKRDIQFQTPTNKNKVCQGTHEAHENSLKEDILQVITENFMKMLPDIFLESRNSKSIKIKKMRRHKNK